MTRSLRSVLFPLILSSVAILLGQDTRGKVQGIVNDSSGAVVTGAMIILLNTDTGVRTTQESSATGQYLFNAVIPGEYTVEVDMPGFRTFVQRMCSWRRSGT